MKKPNELEEKLQDGSGEDSSEKKSEKRDKNEDGLPKGNEHRSEAKLNVTTEPINDNIDNVP